MTMTRTDVHRPSAAEFDPADYDLRGVFDLHPEDGTTADRVRVVSRARQPGDPVRRGAPDRTV
jgi:hypothetical protein